MKIKVSEEDLTELTIHLVNQKTALEYFLNNEEFSKQDVIDATNLVIEAHNKINQTYELKKMGE